MAISLAVLVHNILELHEAWQTSFLNSLPQNGTASYKHTAECQ